MVKNKFVSSLKQLCTLILHQKQKFLNYLKYSIFNKTKSIKKNTKPTIFVLCPDINSPVGGIKQLYHLVDVLNRNSFSAFIVHKQKGFKCTWFNNNTKVVYQSEICPDKKKDYIVVPEYRGTGLANIYKGCKKVIFNQNAYYTFNGYSFDVNNFETPYLDKDIIAVLVVSKDSKDYLNFVFPKTKVYRIHCGINNNIFSYCQNKKKQIAFMPRKLREDAIQVVNILKFRGLLKNYKIVMIDNKKETDVAKVLKESLIFLSFSHREGCALPPLEAMACGCIVVGYAGRGCKEYLKSQYAYPVPDRDVIGLARSTEKVINEYKYHPERVLAKGRKASNFILNTDSMKKEETDIIAAWKKIMQYNKSKW
jgi:glycosyltransferase involved in cell wall biosynthesis